MSERATDRRSLLEAFNRWYGDLPAYKARGGPALGVISAALVVLERLRLDCRLDLASHLAKGGSQIQGVSGGAVRAILERFDEHRPFLREGGRTNRGAPDAIRQLLDALKGSRLDRVSPTDRKIVLDELQGSLVARIREWHTRERIAFEFDASHTTWQTVARILDAAREAGKDGPVCQYLVGAKLEVRYPHTLIDNFLSSTSDKQQGRSGDFAMGDTAFHVTVAPSPDVYSRCVANLDAGLRAYLLVPDRLLFGTKQNCDHAAPGRIFVASVEDFVGGNVDEVGEFTRQGAHRGLVLLLQAYNRRVDVIESDKSLLIEIPEGLVGV